MRPSSCCSWPPGWRTTRRGPTGGHLLRRGLPVSGPHASGFVVLAPGFGAVNLLLIVLLAEALGRAKAQVATHVRVRARIVSAEIGGLSSSVGALMLLIALLAMSLDDLISASTTIVLFLGLRLQNSTFATLSGSVMRLARAHANSY